MIENATDRVSGKDPKIVIACESVLLSDLALSSPIAPDLDFEPARRMYDAEVSLLQQSVRVTAMATSPDASITIAGVPVESGVPTEPIALALGENEIDVKVTHPSGSRRVYRVDVARATEIAQRVYGKASNTQSEAFFGHSMATWDDTLAVGAPNKESVYVFRRSGDAEDSFGAVLALWGDTLAVSATGEDSSASSINADAQADNSSIDSGAVYVFRRFDTSWVQEGYLKASNSNESDRFGASLILQGDTLTVAAPSEDGGSSGINGDQYDRSLEMSGAVYVFQRSGLDWTQEAYIKASNPDPGDGFGGRVSLWGDLLAVSATGEDSAATGVNGNHDDAGAPNSSAVYLFQRTDSSWDQRAYVKASNPDGVCSSPPIDCSGDAFGASVALWHGHVIAAAPHESSAAEGINGDQSDNSAPDSGAIYTFH